ncbi:MAG: helix-turn-helix transcriptional regulator [Marinibacterium sp.]|nr:helix-turn-helix transcriptional regulator [Marinibacterium sp.]
MTARPTFPPATDWASLCRRYRSLLGLKQEAFAQDFRVSQATVSRWEAGTRIPNKAAQARLLAVLGAPAGLSEHAIQSMLQFSDGHVAVWDRHGHLRAASPRMYDELRAHTDADCLIGTHADDLGETRGLMRFTLDRLAPGGFFDGRVPAASMSYEPVLNPRRIRAGGQVNAQMMPVRLPCGDLAVMGVYSHDVLADTPLHPRVELSHAPGPGAVGPVG